MNQFNAERIADIEEIVGKVPIKVNHEEMNAVFVKFEDGSFLYGEIDEDRSGGEAIMRFTSTISASELFRLGIASEHLVEQRKKMQAAQAAYAADERRRLYEALRKEFEGEVR